MGNQATTLLDAQTWSQIHTFWATTTLLVEPHDVALVPHVKDWTSTKFCGPTHTTYGHPSHGSFGCPHIYHGHPTTAILGRPIMWPTSRILGAHNITGGAPRYCIGRPRSIMDTQATAVLGSHEVLWTATRICGSSRMIVDTQYVIVVAHVMRMESHVYSWAPTRKCGLPHI